MALASAAAGAILGGTMGSPFTGIVFAMELTHDWNGLLPLLVANAIAYSFTVLLLKRSILTEKIARRSEDSWGWFPWRPFCGHARGI